KQLDKLFDRKLQLLSEAEQAFPDVTSAASKLEELRRIIEKGNHEVFIPLLSEMEKDGLMPIEHSIRHISEIIRAQQGSAKIATHATPFRLQEVLRDALIMQQDMLDKLGVELVERSESELFDVQLPKNQMIQALNNLIKNSYESIAEQMRVQPGHRGRLELTLSQNGEVSTLIVKDNGVGVAVEQQSEIFGFGYTSKKRGSGFGLHATANFIHSLGGSVTLQSEGVGLGASVTLTVPNKVEDELLQSLKKV
ncbi:MAG: ATP-binding protein, partial [Gammaproteobacteria bacterium]|nr:ATP-binding protein [Gammaproteobacteria bacterium]MBT4081337.1 ATP-binding protein [Gammaproteobacteria bacterium]